MDFHEAANIFPLDEEHIPELAKDIKNHGLLTPIETLDGKIIDGRRRFLACKKAKVTPQFTDVKGLVEDPIAFVLSGNLHRRHLTPAQLGMCAGRATALQKKLKDEAKERQGERRDKHPGKFTGKSGDARDNLGKAFGISGKTVDYGVRVVNRGIPALQAAVDSDEIAVSTAARVASRPSEEQEKFLAQAKGRKGSRTIIREPTEPEPQPGELQGVGVIRANEAINCLKRIPKKDRLRKRGFQLVTDWIKHNR